MVMAPGPAHSPLSSGMIVGICLGVLRSVLDDRRVGYNAAFERTGRRVVNGQMEAGEGNREAASASMLSKIMPKNVSGGGGSIGGTVRGHRRTGSSTKGGGGSGDLVMLNTENEMFALSNLMEAAAEVMGSRGIGSAYRAVLRTAIGAVVIVVVTTFLCITDDRETNHAALDWPNQLKIALGIGRGRMAYLHTELNSLDIPHGNLKSGNVLLGPDFNPLLIDYGYVPLINPSVASVAMFAYQSPESLSHHRLSLKSDVYCLGIIITICRNGYSRIFVHMNIVQAIELQCKFTFFLLVKSLSLTLTISI